jgi:transcriptional regulator with XRE-family HTH domain
MNLIENIEALRARQGLTKTEMASQFGVIFQNYNNWIARSSLPKEHYDKAHELLQNDSVRETQGEHHTGESASPDDLSFIQKYRALDDGGRRAIGMMIDELAAREVKKE